MWSVIVFQWAKKYDIFLSFQPLLPSRDELARTSNPATVPSDIPEVSTVGTTSQFHPKSPRYRTTSSTSRGSSVNSEGQHRLGVSTPEDASRPFYQKGALFTGSTQQLHRMSHISLNPSSPYMASATNISASNQRREEKGIDISCFCRYSCCNDRFLDLKKQTDALDLYWKYLFYAWILSTHHVFGLICHGRYEGRPNTCILLTYYIRYARRKIFGHMNYSNNTI